MTKRLVLAAGMALALAACQEQASFNSTRHLAPIPSATTALMASKGVSQSDPILMRAYKKESELEVWKKGRDGRYALLKTYPICRWSGQLGPKVREGDRQAPEGYYSVGPGQMNPNSSFYLSFDTGFPNAYDRAHGRTGSYLMVHGTCSSRGCFAMTDEVIAEVYAIAREAFAGGQRSFQFQAYPFRMTAENLAKHRADPHMAFWRNLKEGSDYFEVMRQEPPVSVANMRYSFGPEHPAVAEKRAADEQKVASLVGTMPAVRTVYDDGGGHTSFRASVLASTGGASERSIFSAFSSTPTRNLGEVSRPEALAAGPREVPVEMPKSKGKASTTAIAQNASPAPTPAETKSLFQRALSFLGKAEEPAPAAPVPTPPRRGASVAPSKSSTIGPGQDRRAALNGSVLSAAQPVLRGGDTGLAGTN